MSENVATTRVRTLNIYVHYDQNPHGRMYFCGSCGLCLNGGSIYGAGDNHFNERLTPDDLIHQMDEEFARHAASSAKAARFHAGDPPSHFEREREYVCYAFCPYCGMKLEEDWWKSENAVVENERVIDHYQHPGWHASDHHVFSSKSPDPSCMAGHWLGVSGGHELCWCKPKVVPGLTGCEIRHNTSKSHEAVIAAQRAAEDQRRAKRYAERTPMTLPDDHDSGTCEYCESSACDQDACDTCQGEGCEDCEGHGFVGYSW